MQRRILRLANVTHRDTVFDLGCGTGELLITAAQAHEACGVGFELDSGLVLEARQQVSKHKLEHMVQVVQEDARLADIGRASVAFMYLSDKGNSVLHAALREKLVPGTRILCVGFPIAGLQPAFSQACRGLNLFMYRAE